MRSILLALLPGPPFLPRRGVSERQEKEQKQKEKNQPLSPHLLLLELVVEGALEIYVVMPRLPNGHGQVMVIHRVTQRGLPRDLHPGRRGFELKAGGNSPAIELFLCPFDEIGILETRLLYALEFHTFLSPRDPG